MYIKASNFGPVIYLQNSLGYFENPRKQKFYIFLSGIEEIKVQFHVVQKFFKFRMD